MNDTQTENIVKDLNNVAIDTTQTLVDAAYLAQQQSAQLVQAWFNTLSANQQQQREIATRLIQQAQEAQNLLQQYVGQSFRSGVSTFTNVAQNGARNAAEAVNNTAKAASQAGNSSN